MAIVHTGLLLLLNLCSLGAGLIWIRSALVCIGWNLFYRWFYFIWWKREICQSILCLWTAAHRGILESNNVWDGCRCKKEWKMKHTEIIKKKKCKREINILLYRNCSQTSGEESYVLSSRAFHKSLFSWYCLFPAQIASSLFFFTF